MIGSTAAVSTVIISALEPVDILSTFELVLVLEFPVDVEPNLVSLTVFDPAKLEALVLLLILALLAWALPEPLEEVVLVTVVVFVTVPELPVPSPVTRRRETLVLLVDDPLVPTFPLVVTPAELAVPLPVPPTVFRVTVVVVVLACVPLLLDPLVPLN
jgi:hypothetical protein